MFAESDYLIDFTRPEGTLMHLEAAQRHNVKMVIGTTGFDNEQKAQLRAAADKIEKQIAGSVAIERAGTLERAVEAASLAARSGDVVLLAPACASFDQFENYEHRGRVFKQLVRSIEKSAAGISAKKG